LAQDGRRQTEKDAFGVRTRFVAGELKRSRGPFKGFEPRELPPAAASG
jgi:hypothetical protein